MMTGVQNILILTGKHATYLEFPPLGFEPRTDSKGLYAEMPMPLTLGRRVARIYALLVSLWVGRKDWRCCLRARSILVPREGRSLLPYKLVTLKVV